MALGTRDFQGLWGCDTNTKLTSASAKAVMNEPMVVSGIARSVLFFVRYVFFAAARPGDISLAERDDILGAGAGLLLVQHPRNPSGNVLTSATGASDAEWAIKNAVAAGYDPALCDPTAPPTLFLDMEGVKNPGPSSQAHAIRWVIDVRAAGFAAGVYFGFGWGIQDYNALGVFTPWCDFAPLTVRPALPWSLKQYSPMTLAGVGIDPDEARGSVFGMIDTDLALVGSGDGAAGQAQDPAAPIVSASRGFPLPFEVRDSEVPEPPATTPDLN